MSTGPWGHRAAAAHAHSHLCAAGHPHGASHAHAAGHLRASDADREQVLEFLKTAFVQGRLTVDELDARAGLALVSRTYGELAALTVDIPAGPVRALPRRPAAPAGVPAAEPVQAALRTPASAKAAVWAACIIAALPAVWAAFLTFYGWFVILFLLAFIGFTLHTGPRPHDKRTSAR